MPDTDDELNKRLAELWPPRDDWSQREWTALFEVVYRVLSRYRHRYHKPLDRAGLTHKTLIADFFAERIFQKTKEKLILIKEMKEKIEEMKERLEEQGRIPEEIRAAFLRQGYDWYLQDQFRALGRHQGDGTDPDDLRGKKVEPSVWKILQQYGLNPETVIEQAGDFLGARGRWQDLRGEVWWIRLYLAEHHCPDKDAAKALDTLKKEHDIPSYDYKARKLGITWCRGGFEDFEAFQKTFLGQWIQSLTELDRQADPEGASKTGASWRSDQAFISAVLGILCRVALVYKGLSKRPKADDD